MIAFGLSFGFGVGFSGSESTSIAVAARLYFLCHGRRLCHPGILRLLLAVAVLFLAVAARLFIFLRGRGLPLVVAVPRFRLDLLRPLLHHVTVAGRI